MSRIRAKHTTPKKVVRSLLRRLGYRFKLHVFIPITTPVAPKWDEGGKDAEYTKTTGRKKAQNAQNNFLSASTGERKKVRCRIPRAVSVNFLLPEHKTAIFVHGCFWHRHRGCKNCTTPTHRREWWLKKLEGNAARDKLHQRALRKLNWRPIVIWECQTEKPKKLERLSRKLSKLIG